jgi:hypothetical protein
MEWYDVCTNLHEMHQIVRKLLRESKGEDIYIKESMTLV